jgi:hypothetical protein
LARLERAGVIGYASGFFEPAASYLPVSPFSQRRMTRKIPSMLKPAVTIEGHQASWPLNQGGRHAMSSANHRAMHAAPC